MNFYTVLKGRRTALIFAILLFSLKAWSRYSSKISENPSIQYDVSYLEAGAQNKEVVGNLAHELSRQFAGFDVHQNDYGGQTGGLILKI